MELAGSFEIPVLGKPAPGFFHAALAGLGARPDQTVVVGDDIESDVLGGKSLGMRGVLVRTGKFRPSDLEGHDRPDFVIDSVADLPALLARI
jgi:ribonucleotide monophosphatase NagD (HAD superfamily)